MELAEFVVRVPHFHKQSGVEQIKLLAWYLHVHRNREVLTHDDLRSAFRSLHLTPPDVTVYLPRMATRNLVIKARGGYKLEGKVRQELDLRFGDEPAVIAVGQSFKALVNRVPGTAEREFFRETMSCYKVAAFRAAIVMVWNLAFEHIVDWILADTDRLNDFNIGLSKRFPKHGVIISMRSDFEKLKESEVVEACSTSGLLPGNIIKILRDKLGRRNLAAHPSDIVVTQSQADDAISDLINNVVLRLN